MKTTFNTICTAAIAMIASAITAQAAHRTLIMLQPGSVNPYSAAKIQAVGLANYEHYRPLAAASCVRENLLAVLIEESNAGNDCDLAFLGLGAQDQIQLDSGSLTGAPTFDSNIRSLLTEARQLQQNPNFKFRLRMVYMANYFGSTLNDDWLAIGAKVSMGPLQVNVFPDDMTDYFLDNFVKNDKRMGQAATDSFTQASYRFLASPEQIQASEPIVSGDRNLIFRDEFQMALNEQRTFTVSASQLNNFVQVYLVAGQRYSYTTNGAWADGLSLTFPPTGQTTNAAGISSGLFFLNRVPSANSMSLCAGLANHPGNSPSIIAILIGLFRIGSANSITASGNGFLDLFANDTPDGYAGNHGSINVTIKRIK